jgi:VanZ family protein
MHDELRRRSAEPRRVIRWIPFLAMLAVVVATIVAADFGALGFAYAWMSRHPGSDKAGHFLLLGALAFTLNLALGCRRLRQFPRLQIGGLLVALAITVEEISQVWIPTRTFDLLDLAANYAGILCADWLASRFVR